MPSFFDDNGVITLDNIKACEDTVRKVNVKYTDWLARKDYVSPYAQRTMSTPNSSDDSDSSQNST